MQPRNVRGGFSPYSELKNGGGGGLGRHHPSTNMGENIMRPTGCKIIPGITF